MISIAAATCAPGVKRLPGLASLSPPQKPGPSARPWLEQGGHRSGFAALGSRLRGNDERYVSTVLRVIRGLAGHRDVVDMALAQPCAGDPHKGAILLHLADRAVPGIAHR